MNTNFAAKFNIKTMLSIFAVITVLLLILQVFNKTEAYSDSLCTLNITKSVDKTEAGPDDTLIYTLNFTNTGNAECTGGGVKVEDIVSDQLTFIGETHGFNIDPGYGGQPVFDISSKTLLWNAHTLMPGESGTVSWTAKINSPGSCGDYDISNKGGITSKEYSNFQDIVYSNEVITKVKNECPQEKDTLMHFLERSCPSWSVISGNGNADENDATGEHFDEFRNHSVAEPSFSDVYSPKPVMPQEIPASCEAQAGWNFKISTDIDQSQNVSTIGPTSADGEVLLRISDLTIDQQRALLNDGALWVSEIMQPSSQFGTLRCYTDAEQGDNREFIKLSDKEARPSDIYCIAYNVKPVVALPPAPNVIIALAKNANPSFLEHAGGNVSYSYFVTNPGDVPLSEIAISDDKCAPIVFKGGDVNSDQKLDIDEVWMYSCEMNITETTTNTATVTGKHDLDSASASATSKVIVEDGVPAPAIDITKIANPSSLPAGGGEVVYTYGISNVGNVPLSDISLSDDKCLSVAYVGGDQNLDQKLDLDETWIYSCSMKLEVSTTNTASLSAKFDDAAVTKNVSATVLVAEVTATPAIHLSKSVDNTNLPYGGGKVKYTYSVTNPGNVALSDITLSDNKCPITVFVSGDANNDNKLDIGETWTYSCEMNITQSTENTAIASGKGIDQTVTSEAKATVSVVANRPSGGGGGSSGGSVSRGGSSSVVVSSAIKLVKTAIPDRVPDWGGDVIYKYEITNTGASQIHDVTLADDKCQDIKYISGDLNGNKWLEYSEIWNYECRMNINKETTNTAIVTGYAGNEKVTDQATAKVAVGLFGPSIKVVKIANPAELPASGGKVVYSYDITNPASEALQNVTLTDDKCSDIKFIDGDSNFDGNLDHDETWHYKCEANLLATTTNFITARGRVGTSYATDTTSATVTVGMTLLPVKMPKTGGGAAYKEEKNNRNLSILIAVLIFAAGYSLKIKREKIILRNKRAIDKASSL